MLTVVGLWLLDKVTGGTDAGSKFWELLADIMVRKYLQNDVPL